jgi:hypothetical protein
MTPKMAILLTIPITILGLLLNMSYLVVDVREGGPAGHHFIVPVPLLLAQAALACAPDELSQAHGEEIERYLPAAQRMLAELAKVPDAELVRVEQRDQRVTVRKHGDQLRIDVQEHGAEEVHVVVPIGAVRDMLGSFRGSRFDAVAAVGALKRVRNTDLVHVRDGQDEVKVWIW